MKNLIVSLFFFFSLCELFAQTVVWQMFPSDYDQITLVNNNLYKVVRNGKVGLINADGTMVASVVNDNISGFYEGKALVTANDGHGERVTGCLREDGKYSSYQKKYYTLNGQKFFSDGLLSVSDENGKLGYIDEFGSEVCGFDGKYDRIKPFVEGYATVFKNKKYYLIDKEAVPVTFRFKSVGEVMGGTNVYKGKATIWDTNGKFYTHDVNTEDPCKNTSAPQNTKALDYLYRFSSITGLNKEVPFTDIHYNARKGIAPLEKDGLFGYVNAGKTILPSQFSSASQFEDGYAVVSLNGKLGIIKMIDGGGFSVHESAKDIVFYAGKLASCQFNIEIPDTWKDKEIEIQLKDNNGSVIQTKNVNNTYTFTQMLSNSCKKEFAVHVIGEGLRLYEGRVSYSFTKKELCPKCGKDKEKCAGHSETKKDECPTCHKKISECKWNGVH